jgi:GAF domain-containing protein
VVPPGRDPLNESVAALGSVALRLSQGGGLRVVEDLAAEVFFGTVPPAAAGVSAALVAPLVCDGVPFGSLVAYAAGGEGPFDAEEREYWATAAALVALGLHWRALRAKLARPDGVSSPSSGAGSGR